MVDGLSGFPEAIETAYPRTLVQTCIVHLIRNSMAYGSWKERKLSAAALKAIYQAENAGAALAVLAALAAFEAGEWGRKYPAIARSWRRQWEQVIPYLCLLGADPQGDLSQRCGAFSESGEPVMTQW